MIRKHLKGWKWVGEGSHGTVWTARWKGRNNKFVAIKAFEAWPKNGLIIECMRELSILKTLEHPNIVSRLAVFHDEGRMYMIMDGMQRNLRDQIHIDMNDDAADPDVVFRRRRSCLSQILDALSYLHGMRIMHRDVKPDNVLLNDRLQVKLADFGHARRHIWFERCYTIDVCTPPYRAIELWMKQSDYDVDVDLWALGCTAFEMFMGKFLFDDDNKDADVLVSGMRAHMVSDFPWSDLVKSEFLCTILAHTIRPSPRTPARTLKTLVDE